MTFDEAIEILAALEREGVEYVLVGSMAMAALGLVRATRDIDIFVSPDADNVERLRRGLHSVFSDPSIDEITAEDLGGEYPAIQYVPPAGTYSLDILSRLGEAFRYDDLEFDIFDIDGVAVRVATPQTLYRMKKDTIRLQDKADAAALKQRYDIEEDD